MQFKRNHPPKCCGFLHYLRVCCKTTFIIVIIVESFFVLLPITQIMTIFGYRFGHEAIWGLIITLYAWHLANS